MKLFSFHQFFKTILQTLAVANIFSPFGEQHNDLPVNLHVHPVLVVPLDTGEKSRLK
jgi:hypothetical protein